MTTTHEHVYMLWDCRQCGQKAIPCSPDARYCPACGDVRTFQEFDASYLPGSDTTWDQHQHIPIPPPVVARLMSAGASWFCTNCRADNYGDEASCHHCNAPRRASDEQLRQVLDDRTFRAYMDGDQGATAALIEQFGEYAGMRAATGQSFDQDDTHQGQLERAQQGRSAFQAEMATERGHAARPEWDTSDLPTSVASMERTHGEQAKTKTRRKWVAGASISAVLLGGGGVAGVTGIAVWGSGTTPHLGEIRQVSWEHHIYEQRWTPQVREGWEADLIERPEVPPVKGKGEQAGIAIIGCELKHHHYEDYVCGTQQVPCTHMQSYSESYSCTRQESYTESYSCSRSESYQCGQNCSTSRGSNGMATRSCSPKMCSRSVSSTCTRTAYRDVPDTCTRTLQRPIHASDTVDKICQRSIEASSCRYRTQGWEDSDHHQMEGVNKPIKWPKGSLGKLERERREARYRMTVYYDDPQDEEPAFSEQVSITRQEFKARDPGDPVTFFINNFGSMKRWEVGDLTQVEQ